MRYNLHIVRGGLENKLPETHCKTCTCSTSNDNYDIPELATQRRQYSYGIFIGGPYDDSKASNDNNITKKSA